MLSPSSTSGGAHVALRKHAPHRLQQSTFASGLRVQGSGCRVSGPGFTHTGGCWKARGMFAPQGSDQRGGKLQVLFYASGRGKTRLARRSRGEPPLAPLPGPGGVLSAWPTEEPATATRITCKSSPSRMHTTSSSRCCLTQRRQYSARHSPASIQSTPCVTAADPHRLQPPLLPSSPASAARAAALAERLWACLAECTTPLNAPIDPATAPPRGSPASVPGEPPRNGRLTTRQDSTAARLVMGDMLRLSVVLTQLCWGRDGLRCWFAV